MGINYNITDPDFKRNNASAYQLSILVGMDSLVYSVYDTGGNRILLLRSCELSQSDPIEKAISEALNKEDLLGLLYRRVKIVLPNLPTALVPSRLYNKNEKETYLMELTATEDGLIGVDDIEALKLKLVYTYPQKVSEALKKKFPTGKIYSSGASILNGFHALVQDEGVEQVFLFFGNESFKIVLFDRKELLFFNSFPCNAASDVLYFVLLTIEQYGLKPNEVPVFLSGQIVEDSDIYKLLYRYITNLSFLPAPNFVQWGKSNDNVNHNFLFHLHSLLLCK